MPDPITAVVGSSLVGGGLSYASSRKASKEASQAQQQATDAQLEMYRQTREDFAPQRQLGYDAVGALSRLYGYGAPASTGTNVGSNSAPMSFDEFVAANGGPGAFASGDGMGHLISKMINPQRAYQQYLAEQETPASTAAPRAAGSPDMSVFFESPDYQFNLAEGQKAIDRSAAARGGLLSGRAVKEGQRFASGLASREYAGFVDRLMQQAGLGSTGIGATSAAGSNAANAIAGIAQNAGNARASAYAQGAAGLNNAVQGGIQNMLLQRYLAQSQPPILMSQNYAGPLYGGGLV